MAQKLNKNLVVGLTLTGMVVGTSAAIWMLVALRDKDPQVYVDQAKEFAEKGKYDQAARAYGRAFRAANRNNPEYLVLAGDMLMEADKAETAVQNWIMALNIDPQCLEAQNKIVDFELERALIFMSPAIWEGLRKEAMRLLEIDASSAKAHHALGTALVNLREQSAENAEKGAAELQRAVELDPTSAKFAAALAEYHLLEGLQARQRGDDETFARRVEDAEAIFKECIQKVPDSTAALRRYADLLMRLQRFDDARAQLEKAVAADPDDAKTRQAIARYWEVVRAIQLQPRLADRSLEIQNSDQHSVEELDQLILTELKTAIKLDPDDYDNYIALGEYYQRRQPPDPDKAIAVYEERMARPPSVLTGFKGRINRQNQFRLHAQAVDACLAKVGLLMESDASDRFKQKEDYLKKAEEYLQLAVSGLGLETSRTHKLRGDILRVRGEQHRQSAINEYETAKAKQQSPDWQIDMWLGQLYRQEGQPGAAHKAIRAALDQRPDIPQLWAFLAEIALELDQPQNALGYCDEALKLDPQMRIALVTKAKALFNANREDEAKEILAKLPKSEGARGALQDIVVKYLEGEEQQAIDLGVQLLRDEPTNIDALRMIMVWALQADQRDLARQLVNNALEAAPTNMQIKALQIDIEETDPVKRRERLLELIKQDSEGLPRAINLFNFYLTNQQFEEAYEELKKAEAISPEDRNILERLFRVALLLEKWEDADAYVSRAARTNADGANGEFFRGRLVRARGDIQRSIDIFRGALNTFPSTSKGFMWLGRSLADAGRMDEAAEAYRMSVELDPTNGRAHAGLARLAELRGDEETKYKHVELAAKYVGSDPWIDQQLQQKLERENPVAGIEKREAMRAQDPTDVPNLLRLSLLYAQTNKKDKAVERVKEALELAPDKRETVWLSSVVYRAVAMPEDAESLIKAFIESQADVKAKAEAYLMLAQHYRLLPRSAETIEQVDKAYDEAATADESWLVCKFIGQWNQLLGMELDNVDRFLKAAEWYQRSYQKADDVAQSAELRRLRLDVLISARKLDDAAVEVEEYLKEFPGDPRALLYRGEVQFKQGLLAAALDSFNRFLEAEPQKAIGYFRRGLTYFLTSQFRLAVADFRQAKALDPDGFGYRHIEYLGRALAAGGDPEGAITEIEVFLTGKSDEDKRKPEVEQVARVLADILERQEYEAEREIKSTSASTDRVGASTRLSRLRGKREALALSYMNLRPNDPAWCLSLGTLYLKKGDYQSAQRLLHRACVLSDFAPGPVEAVMAGFLDGKLYSHAIEFVSEKVPEERRGPLAYIRWAEALAGEGKREEAMRRYETALDMTGDNWGISMSLIDNMANSFGVDAAVDYVRNRLKSDPQNWFERFRLAVVLQKAPEQWSEALEICNELLKEAPGDELRAGPLITLSQINYNMKNFEEARRNYEDLLRIAPDNFAILNNLAYLLAEDMNQPDVALRYAEQAATSRAGMDSAPILDTVGWVYVLLGKQQKGEEARRSFRNAIGYLTRAISEDDNVPDYHFHIGEAYALEGEDKAAAQRAFQRAYDLTVSGDNPEMQQKILEAARAQQIEIIMSAE